MDVYIKLHTDDSDPELNKMLVRDILAKAKDVVNQGLTHGDNQKYFKRNFEVSATILR